MSGYYQNYGADSTTEQYQILALEKKLASLKQKLDNVTKLLCGVMHELEDGHTSMSGASDAVAGLQKWWTEQQRLDALREAKKRKTAEKRLKQQAQKHHEAIEKQREAIVKRAALAKLTKEDMRALGLR